MQTVCVFCGSNSGGDPAYAETARRLGAALVAKGLDLVYGGGHVGLMGVLADAVLGGGGEVIGVIPQALVDRELAHPGLTELRVVGTIRRLARLWLASSLAASASVMTPCASPPASIAASDTTPISPTWPPP